MIGDLDMKIWDLHVANIARDKVQVQSEGPACSHFEEDFLNVLLNANWMGGGAGGML